MRETVRTTVVFTELGIAEQVEEIMHARETSKFKKLTREEAIRKLGAWSGVNISYTAGVVLLGIQEVNHISKFGRNKCTWCGCRLTQVAGRRLRTHV